ncbi:hypothetical protein Q2941_26180 [Bradyrhizobium sp. UFLA05-153]
MKYVDDVKDEIKKNLEAIGESREHALGYENEAAEAGRKALQIVATLQIDPKAVAPLVASVGAESKSPPQRLNISVGIVSEVNELGTDELSRVAAALQKQVSRDLKPIWGVDAKIEAFKSLGAVPVGVWPMIIKKDIGVVGAAGIHLEKDSAPYSLVTYVPGDSQWAITASHELIDMLVDPSGNRMVSGPSPRASDQDRTVLFLVEPATPVEGSKHAYTIDGVMVSDFVTPEFYTAPKSQKSRYSFNGTAVEPRKIAIDGYVSWMDQQTNEWQQAIWFDGKEPQFRSLGKID